jgi:hypothetical protein
MMSCEDEDVNKWNKTTQNHIAKVTFLGRSWRTNEEHSKWTQQRDS